MSRRPLTIALVVLLGAVGIGVAPGVAHAETVRYAVVIGNNAPPKNSESLEGLDYADNDAFRFYRLARRFGATAYLLTVPDTSTQRRYASLAEHARPPKRKRVIRVARRLKRQMRADREAGDQPVLYFVSSGHGRYTSEGKAQLSLLDGGIGSEFLATHFVEALPTHRTHILVDACHAAGVVGARGDMFDEEVDAQTESLKSSELESVVEPGLLERHPEVGALVAASPGESSHEWTRLDAGVFTHEVLSGLLGGADINGDHRVTYSEIEAFISAANGEVDDPRAVPSIVAQPPSMDDNATLLNLHAVDGPKLVGDTSHLGHFYIETKAGERYLDAHVAPSGATALVLPEQPAYLVRQDREVLIAPGDRNVRVSALQFRRRKMAERGAVADSLHRGLFASTYSRAYYEGYVDRTRSVGVDFSDAARALPETSPPEPNDRWRRTAAWSLWGVGGLLAAGSAATGVLALDARRDFEQTSLQKPARRARRRYRRNSIAAAATGAGALAAGVAGFLLYEKPRKVQKNSGLQIEVSPAVATGGLFGSFRLRW